MAVKNSRRTASRPAEKRSALKREKKPALVRLNLGSGHVLLDDFINVDNFLITDAPNFRRGDIRRLPFDVETADYILADNVLEHLAMKDVLTAVMEMRRVLKTGGRAVVIVPDFKDMAEQWLKLEAGTFNPILWLWFAEIIYGNQHHEGEFHRCPMSAGFINYILQAAGFVNYKLTLYPQGVSLGGGEYPGVKGCGPGEYLRNAMIIADITK